MDEILESRKDSSKEEMIEKILEMAEMDILSGIVKDKEDERLRNIWKPVYEWIE